MIKCFLIAACIFFNWPTQRELHGYRHGLMLAVNSSKTTDSLYNSLKTSGNRSPVILSYMGALEALKAKHAWNPFSKLKYINSAEDTFAGAVATEPDNMEIRFMRFSVEHYVPGFLGVNKNLDADRKAILDQLRKKYYASADKEVVATIIKFLLTSNRCTVEENAYLTKQLTLLK